MAPYLLPSSRELLRRHKLGLLHHSSVQAQSFETLPLHFIHWHPLPTQHMPRYLRCPIFPFVSCRLLISAPHHSSWASSLGTHASPVFHPGHGDITPPFTPRSGPRPHPGHVPRPGPARVYHLLLPRRHCLPTGSRNGTGLVQRIPPGSGACHRPTPYRDRSR